ncbi:branched-chain amino acid ABC transporter permease [Microbacterium sp. 22303]|uniref:branched-chain amino acid ABC transporter permease n=1 Tax=Microbacterium sp. 22303 TaxID=3453905 RepID=UPI003F864F8C
MKLASLLIAGVSLGAMYALVAMGFVIIYKASTVLNFAHGSLVLVAAYTIAATQGAWGFWPATLLAILLTAALAMLIERFLIRPLGTAAVPATIVTIGVDILLLTLLTSLLGADIWELGQPWGGAVVQIAGIGVTVNRLVGLVVAVIVITVLLLALRYTSWGVQMRAVAEDREAAAVVGIRLGRVTATSWAVAGILAAIAAVFLTGSPTPGLTPAVAGLALVAFPAAVIGGLTSTTGALVGGLLVGVAETVATGYQDQLGILGRGFAAVVPFLLLFVVLLIRPQGLFGERGVTRV